MPRLALVALLAVPLAVPAPAAAGPRPDVRFATFNASLNRGAAGQLVSDLSNPSASTVSVRQARNVAEVIQRSGADVILIKATGDRFDEDAPGLHECCSIGLQMITVPEAASRAGRDPETIRRWIRAGRLRARKIGTQHVIEERDLEAALGDPRSEGVPARWRRFDSGRTAPDWVRAVHESRRGR